MALVLGKSGEAVVLEWTKVCGFRKDRGSCGPREDRGSVVIERAQAAVAVWRKGQLWS